MDDLEAAIRSAYGVELDPAFIEMIRFVVNGAPSSGYELPLSFDHFSGPVSDVLTPKQRSAYFFPGAPEFFAFASNGGGGELGFLGHAPELRSAVPRQGAWWKKWLLSQTLAASAFMGSGHSITPSHDAGAARPTCYLAPFCPGGIADARISMTPYCAAGHFSAQARAASRSGTSMTK